MSTWAQRAKVHFSQTRQNSTTETTERVCDFSQTRPKHTTETTETPLLTVLTVQSGRIREKHDFSNQTDTAANDPTVTITTVQTKPPADSASGVLIGIGTIRPAGLSAKLLAASLALDAQIHAAGLDTDRHATAMPDKSADLYAARLARFTDKGLPFTEAQALADRLVQRDRDSDDRRLCLECTHLQGFGRTSWRCGNWQAAGIATNPRSTQLAAYLVYQLQRCAGMSHAFNPTTKVS